MNKRYLSYVTFCLVWKRAEIKSKHVLGAYHGLQVPGCHYSSRFSIHLSCDVDRKRFLCLSETGEDSPRCVLQLTNMSRMQVLVQMMKPDTYLVSASGGGAIKFCILPDGTFENIGNFLVTQFLTWIQHSDLPEVYTTKHKSLASFDTRVVYHDVTFLIR